MGTTPTVGFRPTQPLNAAGHEMEPSVSVPIAYGARPAATAAPLPELDPPADRLRAYGLRVRPPYPLHPEVEASSRRLAHSDRLVLPSTTMPASRSRWTSTASRPGAGTPESASDPAVVGRSAVSMLSLTRTGLAVQRAAPATLGRLPVQLRGLREGVGVRVHTALVWTSTVAIRSRSCSVASWAVWGMAEIMPDRLRRSAPRRRRHTQKAPISASWSAV